MNPRHVVLAAISAAVLAMGVYLFLEVRSGAAAADVAPPAPAPAHAVAPTPAPAATATQPAATAHKPEPAPAPTVAVDDKREHDEPAPQLQQPDEGKPNPKIDAIMDQANKAYDRQDFDEAKAIAGKVLVKMPNNVRMLRIMVSSSCIDGDVAVAQKYFPSLPKFDRDQMKVRCDRYGVTLTDPPQ